MTIAKIIQRFLKEVNVDSSYITLINEEDKKICSFFKISEKKVNSLNTDIIYNILTDTYKLNAEEVKLISQELEDLGYIIGRNQKKLINEFLDYQNENSLNNLFDSLNQQYGSINKEQIYRIILQFTKSKKEEAKNCFVVAWNNALKDNDHVKLYDYLMGIHSKILGLLNSSISMKDIFNFNKEFIEKELSKDLIIKLKTFCENSLENNPLKIIKSFNDKYVELLNKDFQEKSKRGELEPHLNQSYIDNDILDKDLIYDRGNDLKLLPTEEFALVHLTINQELYNRYKNKEKFFDNILKKINEVYRILENHKVFTIKIENIFANGKNLKWELYSILGIYCENFIQTEEKGQFYKPEVICLDMLTGHDIYLNSKLASKQEVLTYFKSYYKGKISIDEVLKNINVDGYTENELKSLIEDCKYIHYGFTFNDCYILDRNKNLTNPELPFIKNTSELLMVFYKYRNDPRKIPCPVCGGLKISGNSFPEIGLRSWECKSEICPERSKSNRGKRYSKKSNFMQWGSLDSSRENIIDQNQIKKWRRDIVKIDDDKSIYEMVIKYFSFPSEKILFIETDSSVLYYTNSLSRKGVLISENVSNNKCYKSKVKLKENQLSIYNSFFRNSRYINRFLKKHKPIFQKRKMKMLSNYLKSEGNLKLIRGDSLDVLSHTEENTFTSAVTSPPYYNARDYSQWPNLYLYLKDMYNIIIESYRTLKPGGVFLFNIGDISDNENTVVKSNMGKKRILLGSYTVFLFQKAGFELIDNIIWDKGEVQSHRQKNDGKFTPHYQKPLNCYEHMFIFKKPGAKLIVNNNYKNLLNKWTKNIVKFPPVIKINNKKQNKIGHTAPFPQDIPYFVAKAFNDNNNDFVLDPFSGAATSPITVQDRNIKGIGIEISNEYVNLSLNRASSVGLSMSVLDFETESIRFNKVPLLL